MPLPSPAEPKGRTLVPVWSLWGVGVSAAKSPLRGSMLQAILQSVVAMQRFGSHRTKSGHGRRPLKMTFMAGRSSGDRGAFHLEQPLILLHQRVLGLGQNELERGLVEILKRRHDRKGARRIPGSGWAIGVTGHIVAATQRAISAMPSWIGSIGKEGQSPRQAVNAAASRELRSCTRASMTRRRSVSSSSPAYCDHINHMHA